VAKPTILDKDQHRDIRIITSRGEKYGDNIHFVPVVADELRSLVLEYAICFIKNKHTGQFGLHSLLGFETGENLYLRNNQWEANYLPMHIRRQPFNLGSTGTEDTLPSPANTLITIDMANTRVQKAVGESLFESDGSPTVHLQNISKLLAMLAPSMARTEAFITSLLEHDLIEPLQLSITGANNEQKRFEGLYSINEEKLLTLKGELLQQFHTKGYLQASYLMLASLGQLQKLITWKKQQQ